MKIDSSKLDTDTPLRSVLGDQNNEDTDGYNTILELLNKPVEINKYDIMSDEMAALVSKHTNYMDMDNNSVVATFTKVPLSVSTSG
jgi:hypothetical protein